MAEAIDKQKWLIRGGAVVAGMCGLSVLLPVIYGAFLASLGVIGVGIAAVLGIGLFQVIPLLGQKYENALLKARKKEAKENPEEQLQNQVARYELRLAEAEEYLKKANGIIRTQTRKLDERARTHPNHDLTKSRDSLEQMKKLYLAKLEQFKSYRQEVDRFKEDVDNALFERELAVDGGELFGEGSPALKAAAHLDDLLTGVAFDSISQGFDKLMSGIEVEADLERETPPVYTPEAAAKDKARDLG